MAEYRLFREGTIPECTTAEWYRGRERAPHLEQPGHRERLLRTAELVNDLVLDHRIPSVADFGCGDGGLLSLITAPDSWGYDLSPEAVRAAREVRHVNAKVADIRSRDTRWGRLTVVTEILEHLVDPHEFVRRGPQRHCQFLVASSPWNECPPAPAYEFHTWAWDMDGYRALIEQGGYRVLMHETVQSFQIVSAVRRQ